MVDLLTLPTLFTVQKVDTPRLQSGYLRHDEIRDTFASLLSEVRYDVEIEPKFQSLQGENFVKSSTTTDGEARPDVKANGLLGSRLNRIFFDVNVLNPHAKTPPIQLEDAYQYQESLKTQKPIETSTSQTEQLVPSHFRLHQCCRTSSYTDNAAHS